MNNFTRALRDAFRFWPLLAIATLCSIGNGALWGLNIGAMFPVIEVTIAGESLGQWIDGEITAGTERVAALDRQIATVREEIDSVVAAKNRSPIEVADAVADHQYKISILETQRRAEQTGLSSSRRLKPYIDRYLPSSPFRTVLVVMAAIMVATGIKHVFQFTNTALVGIIAARITRRIQQSLYERALTLDPATFAQHGTSGFMAHITHTTNMLSSGITNVYGGAIREPLKMISCLIGAALICPRLLLLTLIVVPIVVGLLAVVSGRLKKVCRRLLEQSMGLHHVMFESLNHLRTVQAYGRERHEQGRFNVATLDMQRFGVKITMFNALNRPLTELLAIGMMATAILAGSYLVLYRTTTILGITMTDRPLGPGSLLIFFGLLVGASDPVRKMSTVISGINTGAVAANMLYPILDQQSRIQSPTSPVTVASPHREIAFNDVTFGYQPEHPVLQNVSLSIPHGSTVAILGPNGSGKSSLIHLLSRFYDPDIGSVTMDGIDLREMDLSDLRRRTALVTQSTELFNETIRYNLAYADEGIDAGGIATHQLGSHADFIDGLSEGIETVVGQGGNRLSGGQRQRIALSRALLRDPELLILDEATSQIDAMSEQAIFDEISAQRGRRTVIYITHRRELAAGADMVIDVDCGHIHVSRREPNTANLVAA